MHARQYIEPMLHALLSGLAARWRMSVPGCCEVCGTWSPEHLCADCSARFAAARPRCSRCAAALPTALPACADCLRDPPPFARCICVADYGFPWDRLIARFKYEEAPELAALLARALAAAAERADAPLPWAFVALPLSAQRAAERGYDQAFELARWVGRHTARPAHARVLQRRFDAAPQAGLSRAQRLRNLQGAFVVPGSARAAIRGRHLTLVDDVMTTGATAGEAARALQAAGAARVDLWVVARTPAPSALS